MCGGFQQALLRSPGGIKSSPAFQAQSPAWRISPQPPRGAVGDAAVSYCQCNIFKPIFKWAEGIISRALSPHCPFLLCFLGVFFPSLGVVARCSAAVSGTLLHPDSGLGLEDAGGGSFPRKKKKKKR